KLDAGPADRSTVATAVRFTLEELAARAEGNSVEVRGPPFGVTQCIAGPRHTRGTPPNGVATSAEGWWGPGTGSTDFATARAAGGRHLPPLLPDPPVDPAPGGRLGGFSRGGADGANRAGGAATEARREGRGASPPQRSPLLVAAAPVIAARLVVFARHDSATT